jgi:two-component system sensor histidine kinase GlrK
MKLRGPQSLNGLILVGFGLVALPLLVAVIWALVNLGRLAEQSEQLVISGVSSAENNRQLVVQIASLERLSLQYQVLRNADSLTILQQDLANVQATLDRIRPLAEQADALILVTSVSVTANRIVNTLLQAENEPGKAQIAVADFTALRQRVTRLTTALSSHIETELSKLQESSRHAQQVSAWQTATLIPGTIILVLFFTLLVARPIRQIDWAISQLGQSGFSRPIRVKGPTDLEKLGRQLEWLRVRLLGLAQEKDRFLRHMSHELKTPLANIREGTELLLDGSVGELEKPQREVTDILRLNGLKLQQLIENLLSFSAWQSKNEVLTLTDFPLRALVASVAKTQQLALKSAHIQLKVEVEDISVNADRDKMRTVIDNLLSNAIKFTPKRGTITIAANATPNSFVLEFADTGPGIPEHESPRIFEAFFQGDQEQAGHLAGTGIGLSVVLECIQAHAGSVELVNSDEYPGAHFRIHIPRKQVAEYPRIAANA